MIPAVKEAMKNVVHISVDWKDGSTFPCPVCAQECAVHDSGERTWRHLNFFEHRCYIHARLPHINCPNHAVKTVEVPWKRTGDGFTRW